MDTHETLEKWDASPIIDSDIDPVANPGGQLASAHHGSVLDIARPKSQTVPIIFNSPHSGRRYLPEFVAASPLDLATLRRSEDAFVDRLFGDAPRFGAPLLSALFPRAYLDVNREPFELDPAMFSDTLPVHVNTRSMRVAGGLGTIARVVADGKTIYRDKLSFADAKHRIDALYRPYHDQLSQLVEETRQRFGGALLIDCHSMPSQSVYAASGDSRAPEIILGDRYGSSCAGLITETVGNILSDMGYKVVHNNPYAGGYITDFYGAPSDGRHTLQIEINRALYMNEREIKPIARFEQLKRDMSTLMSRLATRVTPELLAAT